MKKSLVLLTLASLLSFGLMAQKVSGVVKDESGKAFSGATVTLVKAADSASVKFAVTKADGQYNFEGIAAGSYRIKITHVGYNNNFSNILNVAADDVKVADAVLSKQSGDLSAVVVTAKKPIVEIKADKTILNVEGTINSVGQDALELLRKAPGVMVDKDDNLSLSGKNGVRVYIDGKPSPLSGTDLADYLKSMQSSNVEAIEIITNPSAKYDAAGNAGIINIRLKKNKSLGTNGSVNAGWGVGNFPKYNAGISLNNRGKKLNVFGNYNYNYFKGLNTMESYRLLRDTVFDGRNNMVNKSMNHSYKAGVDYYINSKQTVGVMVNGMFNDNSMRSNTLTNIAYQPSKLDVRKLAAQNIQKGNRDNINANANYRFADKGKELNLDADYGRYNIFSDQFQPNIYYNMAGTELYRNVYNMISPTHIDIYSLKADYETDFKKGKLGFGGKVGFVNTDNDFKRYDVFGSTKAYDSSRSNRFDYKENINAVYANYNKQYKGFMVQLGFRVEQTNIQGDSYGFSYDTAVKKHLPYKGGFDRDYIDFFPSVAVTLNKNPMSQWGISASRRIDRPAYQDLNPFEFKLDDYTYMKGNVDLKPQYTNSISISHSYKYKLNTKLSYSHVTDIFAQLMDTADIIKTFMSKQNLASQDVISLNVSYPFMKKQFSSFINFNSSYSVFKADYGPNRKIDIDVFNVGLFMQNSLKFAKTWTVELSGWFNSPSVWQGTLKSKAMGGADLGLQKTILKTKGTVKASMGDIFNTMRWAGSSDFTGQITRVRGTWESRVFRLNFSYRFGNAQVKAARQRKAALEEEQKRTQQSGSGPGQ
ncbi:MAG: TonB-dependent receptor [Sphingobacteriales bacterium]|nr:MAG: TonB-dependent receptor [Sphingobacteriales bacterium]